MTAKRSNRARYRWLLSQMKWHEKAAAVTGLSQHKRWEWHMSQVSWFERQIMKMWKLS